MLVLILIGVPKKLRSTKFINDMKQRVYGIQELKLTQSEVFVVFLGDPSDEIIIFVEGFSDQPERTETVRKTLAQRLVLCCKRHIPDTSFIGCIIHPFDPAQGFYSIMP